MPSSFRGKNKKKIRNMSLVSFFVFSAVFMFHIGTDMADVSGPGIGLMSAHAEQVSKVGTLGAWMWDHTIGLAVNGPLFVVNVLLYMFLQLLSLVLVLATTVFGWAVNPAAAHNMLNMASVYTLWRMIRDFFNLFFILTILFIAFSTIFQVSAYNYKKLLWHLVLMALLVNFSFPVTRFIIDATNVPMYFFMENIFRDKSQAEATQLFGTVFSSTNLREILIPDPKEVVNVSNAKNITLQLLTSIIFMFLFSMSLLVLALLFLVRLVMLTVLIIFSPVGYAGTAIPGFEKYAKQWWESLMKHAIFGPTAMLMLLVAITFLREFKVNQSVPTNSFLSFSKDLTSDQSQSDIISAMATSIVPIILIWTAISVGQMVGVQSAAGITSWAQKTSKTIGKKAARIGGKGTAQIFTVGQANRIGAYSKGVGASLKNIPKTGQLFGKDIGGAKGAAAIRYMGKGEERKKDQELKAKSVAEKGFTEGKAYAATEIHKRNVAEKEKEFEEKKHDEAKLRTYIDPGNTKASAAEKEAAAKMLVKRDALRSQADLDNAVAASRGSEAKAEIVRKVDKKVMQDADGMIRSIGLLGEDFKSIALLLDKVDGDAMKMTVGQYTTLLNSPRLVANPSLRDEVKKKLDARLKKEGRLEPIIEHEISTTGAAAAVVYNKYFSKMTAEEIGKMKDVHGDATTSMNMHLRNYIMDMKSTGKWSAQEYQDAWKKLANEQKQGWINSGLPTP